MLREEAYKILTTFLKNENLIKHSLAAEAAMKGIYNHLFKASFYDKLIEEKWGVAGLLHDADYEMAKDQPEKHGLLLFEKLTIQLPEDIVYAIKAHNPANGTVPKTPMDWGIRCCDQLTGLIVAAALIHPDKKLASITPEFILNRMKEKSFAKGADRTPILQCEEKLRIPLPKFVEIVLKSMQGISDQLGL